MNALISAIKDKQKIMFANSFFLESPVILCVFLNLYQTNKTFFLTDILCTEVFFCKMDFETSVQFSE